MEVVYMLHDTLIFLFPALCARGAEGAQTGLTCHSKKMKKSVDRDKCIC